MEIEIGRGKKGRRAYGLDEIASEVVSKRFGLSDTVAAQIERYEEAVDRKENASSS